VISIGIAGDAAFASGISAAGGTLYANRFVDCASAQTGPSDINVHTAAHSLIFRRIETLATNRLGEALYLDISSMRISGEPHPVVIP